MKIHFLLEDKYFPYLSARVYLVELKDVLLLIDTGNMFLMKNLEENLHKLGFMPTDIDIVVNTHLHFDHCGNNHLFTGARFYIPEADWAQYNPFLSLKRSQITNYFKEFYPMIPLDKLRNFSRMTYGHKIIYKWFETQKSLITFVQNRIRLTPDCEIRVFKGGHTLGNLIVRITDDNNTHVFVGDALLDSYERPNLIFINWEDMIGIANLVREMGDIFYPGHGKPFRIKNQTIYPVN
jgi:glyoxylase-like metal-dependent hydrolase (beta-lactamase superfamily II)